MLSEGRTRVSKSCANCRAVKRRCDKQHPHCGQCIRLHQECPGYRDEWELIFRDQTNRTVERAKGKTVKWDTRGPQPARVPDYYKTKTEPHSIFQFSKRSRQLALLQSSDIPKAVAAAPMIGTQLFASYLSDYFPSKVKPSCLLDMSHIIISGIHMIPQKGSMLEKASSALSCVFLGKVHRDTPLLQYGLWLYSQAIHEMLKALGRKAYSDEIVYTCTLFGQIETHHCPDSLTEWYAHIDGLSAIMQFHRPANTNSPVIAAIYDQHQKFKVLLSRLMHLSEPIILWLREPGQGLLHELIQLLTDLSCIAGAVDSTDSRNRQAFQSLLDDCLALEARHLDFYMKINGGDEDPPIYANGELKTRIPPTNDLFGPAYEFGSVGEANLYIFLWTSLSCVYPLVYQIQTLAMAKTPDCLQIGDDINNSPENAPHHLAAFFISKAIRCLPYCAQEGMNSWAMFYAMFSATQASRVFSHIRDRDRFLWAQGIVQYCARLGFGLAAQLHDIWRNYWFETEQHNYYRLPYHKELTKKRQFSCTQGWKVASDLAS